MAPGRFPYSEWALMHDRKIAQVAHSSRSLAEWRCYQSRGWLTYSNWAFMYDRKIALMRVW
jgi:hypothetical protein